MSTVETDFLVVGAGPAGAALACFLSLHGLNGIMLSAAPTTAQTPRAHITNMAALECLRDIGLEGKCLQVATPSSYMQHTRWCHSMAGTEYARIHSWGHDPRRHGDYAEASPCKHIDLPQTLLEPILVDHAREQGWDIRFNTTWHRFDQDEAGFLISNVTDETSNQSYSVRSKYLFGCDGARSQVVRQLDLPLIKKPDGGIAYNVLVEADLSKHMEARMGNLHWIMQPERETPDWSLMGVTRMVKPWKEWLFICLPKPNADPNLRPTNEEWLEEVQKQIGDPSISARILDVSVWRINEIIAERYTSPEYSNIFCLGDAVHRHPPFNGLGSNTCIQDAYNLAWKVAYVDKGLAHPSLLETYTTERQPVGQSVITRANDSFRAHFAVWETFGLLEPDLQKRVSIFDEFKEASPAGSARRSALEEAIQGTRYEFHALGQEMGQDYSNSPAIYTHDKKSAQQSLSNGNTTLDNLSLNSNPAETNNNNYPTIHLYDPVLSYKPTTLPGRRLPHVWLNTPKPTLQNLISTIDLAGHGSFTILTGVGGQKIWSDAVANISRNDTKLKNITINVHSIGWGQGFADVYGDWARRRGVEDDGCVLVRPDRFVAWRCASASHAEGGGVRIEERLATVLRSILGWEGVRGNVNGSQRIVDENFG